MKSDQSVVSEYALGCVRGEFVRWRAARNGRGKTPMALRCRAVGLLEQHCAFHVCRALGINATALKRWAAEKHEHDADTGDIAGVNSFVTLDAEPLPNGPDFAPSSALAPALTATLTVELPLGIRVHCESADCVVELLEALRTRDVLAGFSR